MNDEEFCKSMSGLINFLSDCQEADEKGLPQPDPKDYPPSEKETPGNGPVPQVLP